MIMFCLWLFAGSLYTYDMAGKRRDEAYEIADEVYEKFKVLKATMFDPLFHSNIRKRIENKSDYLSGGAAKSFGRQKFRAKECYIRKNQNAVRRFQLKIYR